MFDRNLLSSLEPARLPSSLAAAFELLQPRWLRRLLLSDPREVVIDIDRNGDASMVTRIGTLRIGGHGATELSSFVRRGAALTFRVSSDRCLVRQLSLPAKAVTHLDDVLALDLERATPFRRQDVLSAHVVGGVQGGAMAVTQAVTKTAPLMPLIDAARRAQLPIKSVQIADGALAGLELLPQRQSMRSNTIRMLQRATRAAAVVLIVLAGTVAGLSAWSVTAALRAAEAEQASLAATAAALKRETAEADKALTSARFARQRRIEKPLVVAMIEDLTKRLPETTYLTDLRIDETAIALDGHSSNAAELATILARSPYVSGAAFVAPITRDAVRATERFQIRLARLRPAAREASP